MLTFTIVLFSGLVGAVLGGIIVAIALSEISTRNDILQKRISSEIDKLHE